MDIPACIIVVDKEDTGNRQDIFMIDASEDEDIHDLNAHLQDGIPYHDMDIIPPKLIIDRYFQDVQTLLNNLQIQYEEAIQNRQSHRAFKSYGIKLVRRHSITFL